MIYCIKKPEDEEYYNIKKGGIIVGYRDTYFNRNDAYDNNNGWYTCKKCGRKFRKGDMDIDHIIPQKFGGQDSEWNLQCICKHCNRSKQASMRDTPSDLFASSKRISLPAGAASIIPIRTPSAPYLSISSNGSGELPSDFDILRPSLSRTIPVK